MLKKNKYLILSILVSLSIGLSLWFFYKNNWKNTVKRPQVVTHSQTAAIKNSLLEEQKQNIRSANVQMVLENNVEKINQIILKPKLEKDREQFLVQNLHFQMSHEINELNKISPKTWAALTRNLMAFVDKYKDSPPAQSRSLVLASRLLGEIPSQNFPHKSKELMKLVDQKKTDPDIGLILFSRLLKDDPVDPKVLVRAKILVRTARPQLSASLAQSISQMKDDKAKDAILKSMLAYFPNLPIQAKPYWLGLYVNQDLTEAQADRLLKSLQNKKDDLIYEAILGFIAARKTGSPTAQKILEDIAKQTQDPRLKNEAYRLLQQSKSRQ